MDTETIEGVSSNDFGLAIRYLNGKTQFLLDVCDKSVSYSFVFVNGILESTILDNDYKLIVHNS